MGCPRYQDSKGGAAVRRLARVGANATILPGVEIGEGALVGAGSVVAHDVPAGAVVAGNPAKVIKRDIGPHVVFTDDPHPMRCLPATAKSALGFVQAIVRSLPAPSISAPLLALSSGRPRRGAPRGRPTPTAPP